MGTQIDGILQERAGVVLACSYPSETNFDYLYVGESGSQASQGLSEDGGFRYILVIMDAFSNFVSMEPVKVCTAEATAESL